MANGVRIGALARAAGMSVDAIRFYEREGLLREPPRSQGGFRLYAARDVGRLRFLRGAQELGFSLAEIRELFSIQDERGSACTKVRGLIREKLDSVRVKMESLKKLEASLEGAPKQCERGQRGGGETAAPEPCPVLEKFAAKGNGARERDEN